MLRGISGGQKKRVTTGKRPCVDKYLHAALLHLRSSIRSRPHSFQNSQNICSTQQCYSTQFGCLLAGEMLVGPMKVLFADEVGCFFLT
jgi:hypothetical protein